MSDAGNVTFGVDFDADGADDELLREVKKEILPSLRAIEREAMDMRAAINEGFDPKQVERFRRSIGLTREQTDDASAAAREFARALDKADYRTAAQARRAVQSVTRELKDASREAEKLALEEEAAARAADHLADELRDLDYEAAKLEREMGRVARAVETAERRSVALAKAQDKERDLAERLAAAERQHADEQERLGVVSKKTGDILLKAQTRYTDALAAREKAHRDYEDSIEGITRAEIRNIEDVRKARRAAGIEATNEEKKAVAARIAEINKELAVSRAADKEELDSTIAKYKEKQRQRKEDATEAKKEARKAAAEAEREEKKRNRERERGSNRRSPVVAFFKDDNDYTGVLGQANKLTDLFTAKLALIPVVLEALIPLIGIAAGAIGQLGLGLAALGPAAVVGLVALKTGFEGLSEGAKAFNERFKDIDEARFARIGDLMGPMLTSWHDMTAAIQDSFANRLVPTFQNFALFLDAIGPHIVNITDAFADGANLLSNGLHMITPQINTIIESSAQFLRVIMPFGTQLMQMFANLGAAAAQYIPRIAQAFGSVITGITGAFDRALQSGVFDKLMSTFAPTIEALGRMLGSLFDILGSLGADLGPTLAPLLDSITQFFVTLAPAMSSTGTVLAQVLAQILPPFAAAMASLAPALVAITPALGNIINLVSQLFTALSPLINALGGALATVINSLIQGLQPLMPVISALATALAPVLQVIGTELGTMVTALLAPLQTLAPVLTVFITKLGELFAAAAPAAIDMLNQLGAAFTAAFAEAGQQILPMVIDAFNELWPVLMQVNQQYQGLIKDAVGKIVAMLPQLVPLIVGMAEAWLKVVQAVLPLVPQFAQFAMTLISQIIPVLPQLIQLQLDWLNLLVQFLPVILEVSQNVLPGLASILNSVLIPAIQIGVQVFDDIVRGIGIFKTVLQEAWDFASSVVDGITNVWNNLRRAFAQPINFLINTVYMQGLKPAWDAIASFLPGMTAAPSISPIPEYATGGTIRGPGGIDNVLMWGTAGEHMFTVDDVADAGGQNMVYAMRDMIQRGIPFTWDGGQIFTSGVTGETLTADQLRPFADALAASGGTASPEGMYARFAPGYVTGGEIKTFNDNIGPGQFIYRNQIWPVPADGDIEAFKRYIDAMIAANDSWAYDAGAPPMLGKSFNWLFGPMSAGIPLNMAPGYAGGGEVEPWMLQLLKGHQWAQSHSGLPYIWGGSVPSDGGADCSGWVSGIADVILGGSGMRQWGTSSFPGGQPWTDGLGPGFSVGVSEPHTAGTLGSILPLGIGAVNVESGGSGGGTKYGGGAAGADDGQFPRKAHLAIGASGFFEPGAGGSGAPSPEAQRGFIQKKAIELLHKMADPFLNQAGVFGDRPPEWKHILPEYARQAPEILVDAITAGVNNIGDGLSAAWTKAVTFGQDLVSDGADAVLGFLPSFDDGGLASGTGFMPKDVISPERVLSPEQTALFETLVMSLQGMSAGGTGNSIIGLLTEIRDAIRDLAFNSSKQLGAVASNTSTPPGPRPQTQPTAGGIAGMKDANQFTSQVGQAALSAAGQVSSTVTTDVLQSIALGPENRPKNPPTTTKTLAGEQNALTPLSLAGVDVQDRSRFGGQGPKPGEIMRNDRQFDAQGRIFSDTSMQFDRTMTSFTAEMNARFDQLFDALMDIKEKLSRTALEPVVQAAVTTGFEGIRAATFGQMGTALGETAAPPIASAVAGAVANLPIDTNGAAGISSSISGAVFGGGGGEGIKTAGVFDEGGLWESGTAAFNFSGSTERVLNPAETRLFDAGQLGGWNLQPEQQHFATKSGIIGNDTVGADFFGVSQIPIIGTIINALIRVLLKVIGLDIEVRDTLQEMSQDFRTFRGDAFQAFDAQGRIFSDTAGLIDRSLSSQQAVADERIRILKDVINALIKYIIEKVIVPLAKAVANAVIQAGAQAAGMATNAAISGGSMGAAGPAGGIAGSLVSSLISSGGQVGVEIAAEIGTDFALAITEVLIDVIGEGLQSLFPDLMAGIFGGAGGEALLKPIGDLIGGLLGGILQTLLGDAIGNAVGQILGGTGLIGSILSAVLGGGAMTGGLVGVLLAGLSTIVGGLGALPLGMFSGLFDDGGVATGVGLMPKATMAPERVLSPQQTSSFDRLVDALDTGRVSVGDRNVTIHVPQTIIGGRNAADEVKNRLLSLLDK